MGVFINRNSESELLLRILVVFVLLLHACVVIAIGFCSASLCLAPPHAPIGQYWFVIVSCLTLPGFAWLIIAYLKMRRGMSGLGLLGMAVLVVAAHVPMLLSIGIDYGYFFRNGRRPGMPISTLALPPAFLLAVGVTGILIILAIVLPRRRAGNDHS
jgi:hypothetical protein